MTVQLKLLFTTLVFVLGVVFTWTNGFQHASSIAATGVATHSLRNKSALVIMIFFSELIGTIFSGSAVATVIQSLSSWPKQPSLLPLLCSALMSAISWNFMARRIKMPASSTHALIGGVLGALIAGDMSFDHIQIGKFDLVHPSGVIGAVISLFLSPVLGFIVSYVLFCLMAVFLIKVSGGFHKVLSNAQWLLTSALAFGDGQNDTQKTMGLLVLALNAGGYLSGDHIPLWIHVVLGIAMGSGAFFLSAGLMKELAFGVYKLRAPHAVAAESASAIVLISNSLIGGPVSASQVIAAAIMGTGSAERKAGVHWLIIKDIVLSWLVTIPAAALLAGVIQIVLFHWVMGSL